VQPSNIRAGSKQQQKKNNNRLLMLVQVERWEKRLQRDEKTNHPRETRRIDCYLLVGAVVLVEQICRTVQYKKLNLKEKEGGEIYLWLSCRNQRKVQVPCSWLLISRQRGANWGGRTEMRGGFDERRLGFIRASYAHQTLYFCLDSAISQERPSSCKPPIFLLLGPKKRNRECK